MEIIQIRLVISLASSRDIYSNPVSDRIFSRRRGCLNINSILRVSYPQELDSDGAYTSNLRILSRYLCVYPIIS